MESVSEKNNFIYLVVSLVALLLAGALVGQFPSTLGQHIFQAVSVVTLGMSTFGFRSARFRLQTGVVFTLSVLIIVVLGVLPNATGISSIVSIGGAVSAADCAHRVSDGIHCRGFKGARQLLQALLAGESSQAQRHR